MQHISGISHQQIQISSLEEKIALENPVRFVEAFVENISLESLGFRVQTIKSEGRPSFQGKVFLKIYLYGYLNGLRSSRKLEKELYKSLWFLVVQVGYSFSAFYHFNRLRIFQRYYFLMLEYYCCF